MATVFSSSALIAGSTPVTDFARSATSPENHPCSVAHVSSRNFKHKTPSVKSFFSSHVKQSSVLLLSKGGCKQPPLLSHSFLHHNRNSVAALSSHFQEGYKGSKLRGNVARHQGNVKCMAADNGRANQAKPLELVVCFGEMLIDFVPTVGGLSLADAPAFKKAPGGAPANVAVGIARLGGNAAFMGKVGDDEFGYMLVKILEENRVESRGVRFDPGARTALAFVTLREDGEREFMFYRNPSADMLLDVHELDVELIQQATILHYGSISLIAEPCRSAHLKAMEIARKAGVLLSYDPNLRLPLWSSPEAAREGIKSIWDQADIIKISEEEISFLTGGDPYSDEAAMSLWHPNLKLLLVTEGANGCRYYTKDFSGKVKGLTVSPVDTTGAGDAFVGGLLTALVRDLNLFEDETKLREALKFANACGAITTTERGAIPALPDRDTVMRLISNVAA
ncbi:2-dehydro-3-deoxygluconokinase [Marchantia polymorpha subsp. ruderalis]